MTCVDITGFAIRPLGFMPVVAKREWEWYYTSDRKTFRVCSVKENALLMIIFYCTKKTSSVYDTAGNGEQSNEM